MAPAKRGKHEEKKTEIAQIETATVSYSMKVVIRLREYESVTYEGMASETWRIPEGTDNEGIAVLRAERSKVLRDHLKSTLPDPWRGGTQPANGKPKRDPAAMSEEREKAEADERLRLAREESGMRREADAAQDEPSWASPQEARTESS